MPWGASNSSRVRGMVKHWEAAGKTTRERPAWLSTARRPGAAGQAFPQRIGGAGKSSYRWLCAARPPGWRFFQAARGLSEMDQQVEPTTIKKYANRRLYNTGTSTYVTLDDLAEMVKNGEDFRVQDAKSGDDITHSVLTQIIFEQESKNGNTLLPISFLRQLISYYGDQMQTFVPS